MKRCRRGTTRLGAGGDRGADQTRICAARGRACAASRRPSARDGRGCRTWCPDRHDAGQPTAALTTLRASEDRPAATRRRRPRRPPRLDVDVRRRPTSCYVTARRRRLERLWHAPHRLDAITPTMTTLAERRAAHAVLRPVAVHARARRSSLGQVRAPAATMQAMEIEITAFGANYSVPRGKLRAVPRCRRRGLRDDLHRQVEHRPLRRRVRAPWNRGFDYYLGYFASGVVSDAIRARQLREYARSDQQVPLHDMLEAIARAPASCARARVGARGARPRTCHRPNVVRSHRRAAACEAHAAQSGAEAGGSLAAATTRTPLYMHLALTARTTTGSAR